MNTYIVAERGAVAAQDGSELNPYVGFDGLNQAQAIAKPGDTILIRGTLIGGRARITANGDPSARIIIAPHPDGGAIDGQYSWPRGDAAWTGIGIDGQPTEGVHTPLVRIAGDYIQWRVPVRNSRGRLLQIGDGKRTTIGSHIVDTQIIGARTAMVELRNTVGCGISRCSIEDGSNYYPDRTDRDINVKNFSGCIKLIDAVDSRIEHNKITKHYGNVITPGRGSKGAVVRGNEIHDCNGSLIYIEWCRDVVVEDNVMWYSSSWDRGIHSAIVINNEEEYNVSGHEAGNIVILNNLALGISNGLNVWGNEGKDLTVAGILATGNTFLNCINAALRTARNARVKNFTLRNNFFAGPDEDKLLDLRSASRIDFDESNHRVALPDHFAKRAENAEHVRRLAKAVRNTVPPEELEDKTEALRQELRRWLTKADELVPELEEWLKRGRTLVG